MTSHTRNKKWLLMGTMATALLLIPRRSSKKADPILSDSSNVPDTLDTNAKEVKANKS